MATVTLTLKKVPDLYLECDSITPDKFAGKGAEAIAALPCSEGKRNYLSATGSRLQAQLVQLQQRPLSL